VLIVKSGLFILFLLFTHVVTNKVYAEDANPTAEVQIDQLPEEEKTETGITEDSEGDDLTSLKNDLSQDLKSEPIQSLNSADLSTSTSDQTEDGNSLMPEEGEENFFKGDQEEEKISLDKEIEEQQKEVIPVETEKKEEVSSAESAPPKEKSSTQEAPKKEEKVVKIEEAFDVGKEEKELIELSKFLENKIPEKEWSEIAAVPKVDKYVVQEGDYLWIISKKLFGSGFYYSKIWSLNSYITNPHEIQPGMSLVFDTGDADRIPIVKVDSFQSGSNEKKGDLETQKNNEGDLDFSSFGEQVEPPWSKERKKLLDSGIYVQYATEQTYDDLKKFSEISLNKEYEKYTPPVTDFLQNIDLEKYDEMGFDRNSRISFDFKEGFSLNTFITTNIVQDFGEVDSANKDGVFLSAFDHVYVRFDTHLTIVPGEKYSIYTASGRVKHTNSDRSGFKYTIVGQIETIRKVSDLWECQVVESSGLIQRKDRITVYTPKIGQLLKTFNNRNIEALIIDSYDPMKTRYSFGDVVYLDRGRADGVENGNILEVYSFFDRGTGKKIALDPAFKIGEITVISLSDNFSTGLITMSSNEIELGFVGVTKTKEMAIMSGKEKNKKALQEVEALEKKSVADLDLELNLDDINDSLLKKADKIDLSEDELEELEKQEREKSVLQKGEKDLKDLEKLENEIENAEQQLNAAKVDEDKYLEEQDLNTAEKRGKAEAKDLFDALNEIEADEGKKYLDQNLNNKENPYGLNELDLEEIDELLNTTPK
jgi:hypothetical protein